MDPTPLVVTSTAFDEGDRIPTEYGCEGSDVSPPLRWTRPDGTMEFALLLEDIDAPGPDIAHWVVYGIDPGVVSLAKAVRPAGAIGGQNDFGTTGYRGPCPPEGEGKRRYRFTVIALTQGIGLAAGATATEVRAAAKGITIGRGTLTGVLARR